MKATKAMKRAVWADPITAKARIAELEAELEFMSTIQEANDVEITALMEDNVKLEQQLLDAEQRAGAHFITQECLKRKEQQLAALREALQKIIRVAKVYPQDREILAITNAALLPEVK